AYTHLDEKIMKMADKCMLTKRETEVVFKVVKESLTNDEICSSLCIAGHTLNKHLSNIYIKCDVNSRVSLIHKVLS
ncbi:MAG: helix-turn-helix transcriptional regulator, partial [Lentihominibacter sp.]